MASRVISSDDQPGDIILEIDGLIARGDNTFVLRGVKPVELDHRQFETLVQGMVDQGVPRNLAGRLTDEAYSVMQTGLLADAIAQRTRRVG